MSLIRDPRSLAKTDGKDYIPVTTPPIEVVLMIVPFPRSIMDGSTACISSKGTRRPASIAGHQSCVTLDSWKNGRMYEAGVMFIRMSIGPRYCSTSFTI